MAVDAVRVIWELLEAGDGICLLLQLFTIPPPVSMILLETRAIEF